MAKRMKMRILSRARLPCSMLSISALISGSLALMTSSGIPFFEVLLQRFKKSSQSSFLTYSETSVYRPLDSNSVIGFNITQIEDNRILLVGGKDEFNNPNLVLWQGSFAKKDLSSLSWFPIEFQSITPRFKPLCFKLGHNLYIAGGYSIENNDAKDGEALYCCDRYSFKEGKYYKNVHCLPYALSNANRVVTGTDETYALIIGKRQQLADLGILTCYITFNHEDGFVELTDVEFDEDLDTLEIDPFEAMLFTIK